MRSTDSPNYLRRDIEAGLGGSGSDEGSDPFDIVRTKDSSTETLKRWRQAALVINASRRFRYTRDMKREQEKQQMLDKIRAHAQVIRAALLFKEASQGDNGTVMPLPTASTSGDFPGTQELASISRDHKTDVLHQHGGVRGVAELLKTNLEKGICGDDCDLRKRRNTFGSNNYPLLKGKSFLTFLRYSCKDATLIVLMVAAVISLAIGIKSKGIKEGWYDGGSIAFAVILVIVVTAINDYKQSLQFEYVNQEKRNLHVEVIRNGTRVNISIYDIVVGDVVPLNIGDQVPADGVLITAHSLAIDESSMTGESQTVRKDSKDLFLMSGCKVADGCGTMLVTGVGINTEWGLLMASLSDVQDETPLQVQLNGVATFVGVVGLNVALFVLLVLLIRYFTGHTKNPNGSTEFEVGKTKIVDAIYGVTRMITVVVTMVVVAIPEGLPLAVTLTLAYSMRKMTRDRVLVRRVSACETMGSATTICTHKTALTLNVMAVVGSCIGGKKMDPPHNKSEVSDELCSLLLEGVAHNTNGCVYVPQGGTGGVDNVEVCGSAIEKAILYWGMKMGMNFEAVRSESSIINVFPFNSEKKRSGVAVQTSDSKVHIHWKGAAEIVLASCTSYMDANGQLERIDQEKMNYFEKAIEDMGGDSLRCVAIAYKLYEMENVPTSEEELAQWSLPEDDLVLLAIVGLKDPCRPGVKDAVQFCQNAGVKVRMVSGDNLQTAKAIALECGILGSSFDATVPNIFEGKTFRALSDAKRDEIAERILVMGGSSRSDKLLLVQALRRKGHVVAVTGDEAYDAPVLHQADVGLAMGIHGTQVAKDSSDIIILDDNFASVVKAVRWGRCVCANIQKIMQFQLTTNAVALVINVVAALIPGQVVLNPVQLLWVNLIMDALGALALATEPPTDRLMDQNHPPVGPRELLKTNIVWNNLLTQAISQAFALLLLHFRGISLLGLKSDSKHHAITVKNTVIFNTFIFFQISALFKARKPVEYNIFRGVTKNYIFMVIVGFTIVFQIIIIEFLGKFTKTVKLNWKQWIISVVIGSSGSIILPALDVLGLIGLFGRS